MIVDHIAAHDFGVAGPPSRPGPRVPEVPPRPHERPAVNPDPKVHPVHREVPAQPPHEGTDPKQPVRESPTRR